MTNFKIHFFKENQRQDLKHEIISLFENKDNFKDAYFEIIYESNQTIFNYIDKYLPYPARFSISDVSIIRADRLININPNFFDINFRLELPFSSPSYFSKKLFKIVGLIAQKLKLAIYSEFLEDVREFELFYIENLFLQVKDRFKQTRSYELKDYTIISSKKLDSILQYIEQKQQLYEFYQDKEIDIPNYEFLQDFDKKMSIAISWDEDRGIVIPPFVDYIFYKKQTEDITLYASEVIYKLEGVYEQVPGYSKDCKAIKKDKLRKASKIIHKTNFTKVEPAFMKLDLEKIID